MYQEEIIITEKVPQGTKYSISFNYPLRRYIAPLTNFSQEVAKLAGIDGHVPLSEISIKRNKDCYVEGFSTILTDV